MRSLVIIALFFFVNSAFLRDLAAVSISGATLEKDCVESTASSALDLTLTAGAEVEAVGTFTVALTGGENKEITSSCTLDTEDKVTFSCTGALSSPAVGKYTLSFSCTRFNLKGELEALNRKYDAILVEVTTTKTNKKDVTRYILRKIPLVSKIAQFNNIIGDIHIEYVEFKVLKYEIVSKNKSNNFFRKELKKDSITMIVNTQNGHSESIDKTPLTSKRYVSKSRIKSTKIKDDDMIRCVKNEIMNFLKKYNLVK